MRKRVSFVVVLAIIVSLACPVCAALSGVRYTDKDTGVSFIVPAGWKEETFSKDREMLDVKLVSKMYPGIAILYGSTDLWSQLPASDRIGYTRADYNSSVLSTKDIAEEFGVPQSLVKEVIYDGVSYFSMEKSSSIEAYGITISPAMTMLFRVENGWMYTFQVSGVATDRHYRDFKALLHTVEYPEVKKDNVGATFESMGFVGGVVLELLMAILLTAVAYIAFPLIRLAINHGKFEKKKAKRIALWNSVVVGAIFLVITTATSGDGTVWSAAPACLYYWINCTLLTNKNEVINENAEIKQTTQPAEEPISPLASTSDTNTPPITGSNPQASGSKTNHYPYVEGLESILPLGGNVPMHKNDRPLEVPVAGYIQQKETNSNSCPNSSQTAAPNKEIRFCRKCGYKLPEGSVFCSNCGTRVIDVNE